METGPAPRPLVCSSFHLLKLLLHAPRHAPPRGTENSFPDCGLRGRRSPPSPGTVLAQVVEVQDADCGPVLESAALSQRRLAPPCPDVAGRTTESGPY